MASLTRQWPLAHRDAELQAFSEALAEPGRNLVVLYGPAGVGKTRLADACLDLAEERGYLTARVLASKAAALLPLGALAPILPHDLVDAASPRVLFERTRDELHSLGGGERLVLLVDDAHLLDASSAVLLSQLIEAGAVFVVATIRDGEPSSDAVAGWWRSERALRMDLRDLDRQATADLLAAVLGGPVGTDTVARFHTASGGNPLLLRELLLQALEAGRLADASGTWRITGALSPSRRLADLFADRLAALTPSARSVLEQVAVCAPVGAAELTSGSADELEALELAGLVRVIVDGQRRQLVVSHPLYGEAVRAGLGTLRRQSILLAAADRVDALGAKRREDSLRIATWRLDAGGTPDPAVLLQAAYVARHAHDFAEVERLGEVLHRVAPSIEAVVLLGEARYELGHFHESEALLAAPVEPDAPGPLLVQRATLRTKNLQWGLCDWEQALRVVNEAKATVGPELVDELVAEEGSVLLFSGHPQAALDVLAAIEPRSPRVKVQVAMSRGPSLAAVGRTAEGIQVAAEGFQEHLLLQDDAALAHPGTHLVNQAFALVEAGRLGEAEELAALGYEVAVADKVPIAQIWFALVLARTDALRGRYLDAARWFREGSSTARLHGFTGPLQLALAGLASADAVLGRVAEAVATVEEHDALAPFPFLGHDKVIGTAWTAWASGEPQRARDLLLHEAHLAEASSNVTSAAWLLHDAARLGATGARIAERLAALAAVSDSELVRARAAHVAAAEVDDPDALVAVADRFEAMGALLMAAEAVAAAGDAQRRRGAARSATALANRSKALHDQCPGTHTPALAVAASVAVPLSSREREVATLAAAGLTSQEIADRLYLSIRTVDNHLAKVYAKLGVNKRDQLAEAMRG